MSNLSVVIPSKTLSNLIPCIEAVQKHEPAARIIVIDDGLTSLEFLDKYPNTYRVMGIKPFAFPRACNSGMRLFNDDVVLLNDDALLESPMGFSLLQTSARTNPEYGIISSTTNVAGNPQQFPKSIGLRDAIRTVAFVCVFIPRKTIDNVGLMDERFGGLSADGRVIYGWCDNDYCRRVTNAGLKIGIHDGCFVDHGSLRSSFRGDPHAAADISLGAALYEAKWGDRR